MSGHLALLTTISGGDPMLLRALSLIEDRAAAFSGNQLKALRKLTNVWVGVDAAGVHDHTSEDRQATGLTQRQRQILVLLGEGLTVQAIAHRLYLSPRTVGKHLERMYRRMGTSDRLSTVLHAQRSGLLPVP